VLSINDDHKQVNTIDNSKHLKSHEPMLND